MAVYLGLDLGVSGGLAALNGDSIEAVSMPKTEKDIWYWICQNADHAVIEKVGGYIPKSGSETGQPGSRMFTFGASYGGLRMALVAAAIPFEEVPPQRWQKGLHIFPRGKNESKQEWKNRLRALAQQLYPDLHITLATADAILLATYCKRKCEGTL